MPVVKVELGSLAKSYGKSAMALDLYANLCYHSAVIHSIIIEQIRQCGGVRVKFYSVQLREYIEVPDNQVRYITAKNGRKAAQAEVERDGKKIKLMKFVGKEQDNQ